jgi:hypothetical protein
MTTSNLTNRQKRTEKLERDLTRLNRERYDLPRCLLTIAADTGGVLGVLAPLSIAFSISAIVRPGEP